MQTDNFAGEGVVLDKAEFENLSFVIDENYIIGNFNEAAKAVFPKIEKGALCYKSVRNCAAPCPDCPIFIKSKKGRIKYTAATNGKKYFASFSNIILSKGEAGYIVSASEQDPKELEKDAECELLRRKAEIYRKANYYCAYCYFECNLSKDLIITDIKEVVDEVEYSVDMETRGFTLPIRFSDYVEWFHDVKVVSNRAEYQDMTNVSKLLERFENGETNMDITFRARSTSGYLTWQRHSIYLYRDTYTDDVMALYVLRDIAYKINKDEETKRNEDIMRILASEYATVLYVDLDSESVSFCSLPSDIDHDIREAIKKSKFRELWQMYVTQRVRNSDADSLLNLLDDNFIKGYLKNKKSFSDIFRVGTEEDFAYYEIKIVKVGDGEPKALVIGIANKDDTIRTQQEQQRQIETALILAQKDALTDIRNRTGYDICERELDKNIKEGTINPFAVVMFDVNGLKITNDVEGHDKGNMLLINSSKLICSVFKHSSVYRIGGDEFAAILLGEDYKEREELLKKVREIVRQNEEKGAPIYENVSMASGMATYNPIIDSCVDDVMRRADTLMYENKAEMKANKAKLRKKK